MCERTNKYARFPPIGQIVEPLPQVTDLFGRFGILGIFLAKRQLGKINELAD